MLYWRFHFVNEIQSLAYLLNGSEHIYWIWDLKNEVHSTWDLWISGLQECKDNNFFEASGQAVVFSWVLKIWRAATPTSIFLPKKVRGGNLMSAGNVRVVSMSSYEFLGRVTKISKPLTNFFSCVPRPLFVGYGTHD